MQSLRPRERGPPAPTHTARMRHMGRRSKHAHTRTRTRNTKHTARTHARATNLFKSAQQRARRQSRATMEGMLHGGGQN
jgi:hypothetical protein